MSNTEWRVCGASSERGAWQGSWTDRDPLGTPNSRYDLRQMLARNDRGVWVERREITVSPERIDVAAALGQGGSR